MTALVYSQSQLKYTCNGSKPISQGMEGVSCCIKQLFTALITSHLPMRSSSVYIYDLCTSLVSGPSCGGEGQMVGCMCRSGWACMHGRRHLPHNAPLTSYRQPDKNTHTDTKINHLNQAVDRNRQNSRLDQPSGTGGTDRRDPQPPHTDTQT